MGKYCSMEAVQTRLAGKVKFGKPGEPEDPDADRMSLSLLNTLIGEAESQLEIDLMDRYELPFQGLCGEAFSTLPDNTKTTLKNLAELISVIRVLETDFGRGTSANAEKYVTQLEKRYTTVVEKLMAKQEENKNTSRQWKTGPLYGLKVSYNNQADNGFRGRVTNLTPTSPHGDFAAQQINSPGETVWNGLDYDHHDGEI